MRRALSWPSYAVPRHSDTTVAGPQTLGSRARFCHLALARASLPPVMA